MIPARFLVGVLLLFVFAGPGMADDPPAVRIQRLTMESTLKIAQAAVAACRERGIQIGVVVMDRGGNVQLALRDTLAADVTLRIAQDKAYTALSFNVSTAELGDRARSPLGSLDGFVMLAGGLPIEVGGVIYGAVGVSGAPSAAIDEHCAAAGVEAIVEDLEMAQ